MVDTCHYVFVQTHKMTTPRVNLVVNHQLWVKRKCQCRITSCGNCPIWRGVDTRGGVHKESLNFPLNFALNLKLL